MDDCTNASVGNWAKTEDGQSLAALVVSNDDVFDAEATVSAGNKKGYWDTNVATYSTTVYAKCRWRVKCGNASVKVGITLVFNDATTQDILVDMNTQVWKAGVGTITSGKTLTHVRFNVDNAVGHVYIDFILIYKADFTIPNTGMLAHFSVAGRLPILEPVSALGDTIQNLGLHSAVVEMHCNLDIGVWTRAGDLLPGQVFLDIIQASMTEPFQWIVLGVQQAQFKVLLVMPDFQYTASESKASHNLLLTFREYRRAPANSETAAERFGLT